MKNLNKICLFLFFLLLLVFNFINTSEISTYQNDNTRQVLVNNSGGESYNAEAPKTFDGGFSPELQTSEVLSLNQIFSGYKICNINNKVNSIDFLFGTEIFPNAP